MACHITMQRPKIAASTAARQAAAADLQRQQEEAFQQLLHVSTAAEAVLQARVQQSGELSDAVAGLIAELQKLVLLPRMAFTRSLACSDMLNTITNVDAAMTVAYTIEPESLIESVIQLWDSAASHWLLPAPAASTSTGQLGCFPAVGSLLHKHQEGETLLPAVIILMHSFVRITGVNPVAHSHSCGAILANLMSLVLTGPTNTADLTNNQAHNDSNNSPGREEAVAAEQLHKKACTCLFEIMAHGPLPELLRAEQQYNQALKAWTQQQQQQQQEEQEQQEQQQTRMRWQWQQQSAVSQQLSKPNPPPALFSQSNDARTGQPIPTSTDAMQPQSAPQEPPADHVPYALQVYQLLLWVLQHSSFDTMEWDECVHPQRVMELLVQCCTGFGASIAMLDSALLASLHPIAVALVPSKASSRSKAKRGQKSVTASSQAGDDSRAVDTEMQGPEHDAAQGAAAVTAAAGTAGPAALPAPAGAHTAAGVQVDAGLCEQVREWVWTNPGLRVLSMCAAAPNLPMLLAGLLHVTGGCQDKAAGSGVLELLKLMHAGPSQLPALLTACVELLRPETNCAVDVRIQAVQVMRAAVERHMKLQAEQARDTAEQQQADASGRSLPAGARNMWSAYAQDVVLFCVMHDPSTKVRRGAVQLLPSMLHQLEASDGTFTAAASQVVEVLVSKTRDKDDVVAEHAVRYLLTLPEVPLHAAVMTCGTAEGLWLLQSALQLLIKHPQEDLARRVRVLLVILVTGFISSTVTDVGGHQMSGHLQPTHPIAQLLMMATTAGKGGAADTHSASGAQFLQQACTALATSCS